ncbi:unnamed protein product, partial [Effrenium voratum]
GGKKGRGPKAEQWKAARPPPDPNKERLLYMLTCLHGHTVTVKLKNQQIWEGTFHACSSEGDIAITLKSARQVPTGRGKSGEVVETMVIEGKDFMQVSAQNVPPAEPKSNSFKTDGEIAESWGEGRSRELVAWTDRQAAAPAGVNLQLESSRQIGTWNQFEINETQFGVKSTYSEDLYTTKLDPSKIPEQRRKDADRIAREIESGQNYSRIEEGVADDVDEEAQFSAVASHSRASGAEPIPAPLTMENVSQHDAASAELHHGDGFAREHRAKRYMITAHSSGRTPQLSEMKSINALNLEPALPKFDDKTRSDWINFKQSRARQGQPPTTRDELHQSLQAFQQKEGGGKKPSSDAGQSNPTGAHADNASADADSKNGEGSKFSFNPSAKEFSFNPQAATFTPTSSSAAGRTGDKVALPGPASASAGGAGGGGGGTAAAAAVAPKREGEKAMAPGPVHNARPATRSFAEFLKPAKPGGRRPASLEDLLSRLYKTCESTKPQNCAPTWEATGPSYKEILGQPTPNQPGSAHLLQQVQSQSQQQHQQQQAQQQAQQQQQAAQQAAQQQAQQAQAQQQQAQQAQAQQQQAQQQQQQQQQQQMGMHMMQPSGACGQMGGGFIMAMPGCGGNSQQMLPQQMFQQMPGGWARQQLSGHAIAAADADGPTGGPGADGLHPDDGRPIYGHAREHGRPGERGHGWDGCHAQVRSADGAHDGAGAVPARLHAAGHAGQRAGHAAWHAGRPRGDDADAESDDATGSNAGLRVPRPRRVATRRPLEETGLCWGAELLQHALRLSELEAGGHMEEPGSLLEQPVSSEGSPQEALERARLREEQEAEYQESLRIDRERAAEKALRQKEEEERQRREAEELESKVKEAEALERAQKEKAEKVLEEAKQLLPPEPGNEPGLQLQFQIRLPDGRRLKRAFRGENTIGQVYAFAIVEAGEALAGRAFRLVETMPRRTYEDRDASLAATGLKGPCTLLVEFTDDE